MKQQSIIKTLAAAFVLAIIPAGVALAATDSSSSTLNQTITTGSLSTGIYAAGDSTPVTSPTVAFPAVNVGFSCQTATATLGDVNNLVNVTNLNTSIGGWSLAIAATSGATATWSDSGSHTYKYNDATGTAAGCTNGQLTVDPSVATLADDCNSVCSDTNVTQGSSAAFASGTSSVTLMSDSDGSPWEGYLKGIDLSQKIPASQAAGAYSLPMTLTVTSS